MPLTTYTAGEVLTAASLNANFTFAANTGLTLITAQTIGTTVSSVTVTGAFSATYDNYFITVNGGVASTNNSLVMTLGATTTGYYYVGSTIAYNASPTFVGEGGVNTSNWGNSIRGSANSLNGQIYVYDPFAAKNTHFSSIGSRSDTSGSVNSLGGYLANTTSYTAFTLTTNSGTVTGGTIRVYGLANSQDYMTYKIQIDDLVRDATADEAAQIDAQRAAAAAEAEAQAAKAEARQAVFDKLGLTADEAAALLGQFGNTYRVDRLRKYTRQHDHRQVTGQKHDVR